MKATTTAQGPALWRILLAALVALAIVSLASGAVSAWKDGSPQFDQLQTSGTHTVALRGDARAELLNPATRSVQPPRQRAIDRYESPRPRAKKPQQYDGIWDNPRLAIVIRRLV